MTWKGPKSSVVHKSQLLRTVSMSTCTAVGSQLPQMSGILWFLRGFPPNRSLLPGRAVMLLRCAFIFLLFQVRTGPTVKSQIFLLAAKVCILARQPALIQLLCTNTIDWAEHFWPLAAQASWSAVHATQSMLATSGPNTFQSKPASSILIFPQTWWEIFQATELLPVNWTSLKSASSITLVITSFVQLIKLRSSSGNPQCFAIRRNCYRQIAILLSHLRSGLLPTSRAPNSWRQGISIGKLKGAITHTFPQGHLYPDEVCPSWSPDTLKDLTKNLGLSPAKFQKNFLVTIHQPRH